MIYIAKDYEGKVLGIVNARNKDLANAYWQGRGVMPHKVRSLSDYPPLEDHPTGVYPIYEYEK